jgi:RNA polymerase sigma-70 factor (TIGR02960 family)
MDDGFQELTGPYWAELRVHCYRMLGNLHDAEDVLQETLLAAWQGLAGFEGRASLRTWLYRIATNRCLNKRRSRRAKEWDVPGVELPAPTRLGEVVWLEPFPDAMLPETSYELRESISLAFVTALQTLPPRQVAVLLLREVLGFPADEVAEMLGTTVDSVKSALKRARAALPQPRATTGTATARTETVARFVRAWEAADIDGLVALLTDDVFISMPPMPYEYLGREAVARFCAGLFAGGRRFTLAPTAANGQPAFGAYVGGRKAGLYVLALDGERISAMTRFEAGVLPSFGLSDEFAAA